MSKLIFSIKDIEILNSNPNFLHVLEKSITYSHEFSIHFIEEYLTGKMPTVIFAEGGFDIDIIGMKHVEESAVI